MYVYDVFTMILRSPGCPAFIKTMVSPSEEWGVRGSNVLAHVNAIVQIKSFSIHINFDQKKVEGQHKSTVSMHVRVDQCVARTTTKFEKMWFFRFCSRLYVMPEHQFQRGNQLYV